MSVERVEPPVGGRSSQQLLCPCCAQPMPLRTHKVPTLEALIEEIVTSKLALGPAYAAQVLASFRETDCSSVELLVGLYQSRRDSGLLPAFHRNVKVEDTPLSPVFWSQLYHALDALVHLPPESRASSGASSSERRPAGTHASASARNASTRSLPPAGALPGEMPSSDALPPEPAGVSVAAGLPERAAEILNAQEAGAAPELQLAVRQCPESEIDNIPTIQDASLHGSGTPPSGEAHDEGPPAQELRVTTGVANGLHAHAGASTHMAYGRPERDRRDVLRSDSITSASSSGTNAREVLHPSAKQVHEANTTFRVRRWSMGSSHTNEVPTPVKGGSKPIDHKDSINKRMSIVFGSRKTLELRHEDTDDSFHDGHETASEHWVHATEGVLAEQKVIRHMEASAGVSSHLGESTTDLLIEDTDKYFDPSHSVLSSVYEVTPIKGFWSQFPLVNPFSPRYRRWSALLSVLAVYCAAMVPAQIAFELTDAWHPVRHINVLDVVNHLIDAAFVVDVVVSARLAFVQEAGHLNTSGTAILLRYCTSGELLKDVLSAAPWDVLFGLAPLDWDGVAAVRALGLVRMGRFRRVLASLASVENDFRYNYFALSLGKFLAILVFAGHWWGCGLYFLASVQGYHGGTWVGRYAPGLQDRGALEKYVASIYWSFTTLTTVGFGDTAPVSEAERVFTILVMLTNVGISAYIVGNMTLLATKRDAETAAHRSQMSALNQFMVDRRVPRALQQAALAQVQLVYNMTKYGDQSLEYCPPQIRLQIRRHLYKSTVASAYLFQGCTENFVDQVTEEAKVAFFYPGTVIVGAGDVSEALYIILDGEVNLVTREGAVMRILTPGQMCGEEAIVTDIAQPWTARARIMCRMLKIRRETFRDLVRNFDTDLGQCQFNVQCLIEEYLSGSGGHAGSEEDPRHRQRLQEDPKVKEVQEAIHQRMRDNWRRDVNTFMDLAAHGEARGVRKVIMVGIVRVSDTDHSGRTAMHHAALAGHPDVVSVLLEFGASPNVADKKGSSPLAEAALRQHRKTINVLLKAGAQLIHSEPGGLLCKCAYDSDSKLMDTLLHAGADPNAADYDGRTALHLACAEGVRVIVLQLLNAGAHPNCKDRWGHTPLSEARENGHRDIVNTLLQRGGRDRFDGNPGSVICKCAAESDASLLDVVLKSGADPNSADYDGRTGLHLACAEGLKVIAKRMLDAGADINCCDRWGHTPLSEAREHRQQHIVEFLIPQGAKDNFDGDPGGLLCKCAHEANSLSLRNLLASGADPNAADYDGRTALHLACAEGQRVLAGMLIDAGADINVEDRWGHTPLSEAREHRHAELVSYLHGRGARENFGGQPGGLLCKCAFEADSALMDMLLASGADPNAADYDGRTALHLACAEGVRVVAEQLLVAGANVNCRDRWGQTPLMEARRHKQEHIGKLLLAHGADDMPARI